MNRTNARVLAFSGAALILGALTLAGIAMIGYGMQVELSKEIGASAAALVAGGVFLVPPAVAFAVVAVRGRAQLALKGADLGSTLNVLARTALLGVAARRPMATLGLAAIAGAALSSMAEAERK